MPSWEVVRMEGAHVVTFANIEHQGIGTAGVGESPVQIVS